MRRGVRLNVLITGVCGFVGSSVARQLIDVGAVKQIYGVDNLARRGSETNRRELSRRSIDVRHGDLRLAADLETIPRVDWVIDAAAVPSVTAAVDGDSSSLQLVQHNLLATINLLEFCKRHQCGLILLSTSRVYSINSLRNLPLAEHAGAFELIEPDGVEGLSANGIGESFSTAAPVSMYGATKLASEHLSLEYGLAYQFPVWINRCGVLAGAGQFGRADQGIFSFWLHSHRRQRPLRYTGFNGSGYQVRDCLNVRDLTKLVRMQMNTGRHDDRPRTINVGGGMASAISLKQLTDWCDHRFGKHDVQSGPEQRPFDVPWVVLDATQANRHWNWRPEISLNETLEEIAVHAEAHPDWLELSQ